MNNPKPKSNPRVGALALTTLAIATGLNGALIHEPNGVIRSIAAEDNVFEIHRAGTTAPNKIWQLDATLETGPGAGSVLLKFGRNDAPALTYQYTGGASVTRVGAGTLPPDAALATGKIRLQARLFPASNAMRIEQTVIVNNTATRETVVVPLEDFSRPESGAWDTVKVHISGDAAISLNYRAAFQGSLFMVR